MNLSTLVGQFLSFLLARRPLLASARGHCPSPTPCCITVCKWLCPVKLITWASGLQFLFFNCKRVLELWDVYENTRKVSVLYDIYI